jgi:hypothetical protein
MAEVSEESATSNRLELAPTGRARCRACSTAIEKGTLRYGEVLATSYGEGDASGVFWFHPRCAAQRRPEKFLATVRESEAAAALPDREQLVAEAEEGVAHPRLERVAGAERASSGRAMCRQCRALIEKGQWRIRISSFGESGFFDPLGFVHARCSRPYFGVDSVSGRVQAVTPLDPEALQELRAAEAAVEPTDASAGEPPAAGEE